MTLAVCFPFPGHVHGPSKSHTEGFSQLGCHWHLGQQLWGPFCAVRLSSVSRFYLPAALPVQEMTTRSISCSCQTPLLGVGCCEQEHMICKDLVRQGYLKASDRHLEKRLCILGTFKPGKVITKDSLYSQKHHRGLVNC